MNINLYTYYNGGLHNLCGKVEKSMSRNFCKLEIEHYICNLVDVTSLESLVKLYSLKSELSVSGSTYNLVRKKFHLTWHNAAVSQAIKLGVETDVCKPDITVYCDGITCDTVKTECIRSI